MAVLAIGDLMSKYMNYQTFSTTTLNIEVRPLTHSGGPGAGYQC
jgi:hypothetical protein